MKRSAIFLRMIGLLGIIGMIVGGVTPALIPNNISFPYDITRKIKGFYEEPENSLDLIFVGSSQLFSTINPAVLWREQGITSYVFAANEQNPRLSYYFIREALKYQHPKAIVLDMFYCDFDRIQREAVVRLNLDDMRWGRNKIEAILNNVPPDQWLSYFFPIMKYHERWSSLGEDDFREYSGRNPYKGWSPYGEDETESEVEVKRTPEEISKNKERRELNAEAMEWIERIFDYCEEEQIELIFLKTPNEDLACLPDGEEGYKEVEGQPYYNTISDLAEQKGVFFVNYNVIMTGTGHNDVLTSQKVTSHFGNWYVNTHKVIDKRNLPEYSYWDEDAELGYEYIDKARETEK